MSRMQTDINKRENWQYYVHLFYPYRSYAAHAQ